MRIVHEYPSSAKDDTLKARHLIGEATAHGELVVGTINGVEIQAWPFDDVAEIMDSLNHQLHLKQLEESQQCLN